MIRLFRDLGFIIHNWRYFHAHHALWIELRDWFIDYDRPRQPQMHVDYSINVGNQDALQSAANITSRQQNVRRGS